MKKDEIINSVYTKLGALNRVDVAQAVSAVFELIRNELVKGGVVKISGFGAFIIRDKKARIGRNPKTGKSTTISARRVVTFHPSPVLRKAINLDEDNDVDFDFVEGAEA